MALSLERMLNYALDNADIVREAISRQLSEEPLVLCVLVRLRRPDQRSLDGLRHAIEDNHALTSALSL